MIRGWVVKLKKSGCRYLIAEAASMQEACYAIKMADLTGSVGWKNHVGNLNPISGEIDSTRILAIVHRIGGHGNQVQPWP